MSADSLQCHFGKAGNQMYHYDKALQYVFVSQPSPCYALGTQHPAFSLLRALCVVSYIEIFRFLNCSARTSFFRHLGHIQCQVHVGLFQLYLTSLPCHSCRHVENLQDIS